MRFCQRGHELKPENTYVRPNGTRACKTCKYAYDREYRQRNPEKIKAYKREYYEQHRDERLAYAKRHHREQERRGIKRED